MLRALLARAIRLPHAAAARYYYADHMFCYADVVSLSEVIRYCRQLRYYLRARYACYAAAPQRVAATPHTVTR